ncbi:MAG TPA: hypothetical protein DEB05_14520 [Firmicutes bacterium]|jgi:hypothetical protein|nr:hypothetical protein [Bacillota bacterium]HBT18157.1 hypothetical protein [Bacillota bacterium]
MLFYSIYPLEVILDVDPEEEEVYKEIEFEGKKFLVTVDNRGEQRITRLLSTDPNDFLDPRWTPGNMIF